MGGADETYAEGKRKVEEHFSGLEGRRMLLAWVASQEKEDPWSDEP